MLKNLAFFMCVAAFSGAAIVQALTAAGNTGDPAKIALVEEMFRLTKPDQMMQQALQQYKAAFAAGAEQNFSAQVKKFDDPAKYQSAFHALEDKMFALLAERFSWQTVKPSFEAVYLETFSTEELSGIVAFYHTPAGQAMLEKQSGLMAKCNAIGQKQVADLGPQIQKMVADFMAELKHAHDANQPPPQQ